MPPSLSPTNYRETERALPQNSLWRARGNAELPVRVDVSGPRCCIATTRSLHRKEGPVGQFPADWVLFLNRPLWARPFEATEGQADGWTTHAKAWSVKAQGGIGTAYR